MENAPTAAARAVARPAVAGLATTTAILAAAGVALAAGLVVGFWFAPTDASTLGFTQKIFYFHAPIAETALLAFGVAFVAALLYLRRGDAKCDRLGVVAVRARPAVQPARHGHRHDLGQGRLGRLVGLGAAPDHLSHRLSCCTARTSCCAAPSKTSRAAPPTPPCSPSSPSSTCRSPSLPPASCRRGCTPSCSVLRAAAWTTATLIAFLISMVGMTLLFVALLRRELGIEALREELRELKYRLGR